jgi:predicted GNAT superfamily acetyltransferase
LTNGAPAQADSVTISEVRSLAEVGEWQAAEAAVWSGSDLEVLPSSILVTLQRYGGLLLAARDQSGNVVGVLLGFPGFKAGKVVHCSHMLGILSEWRSLDIGFRMKCRQREYVLEQGLDLIVWTFDPLETRNARLNTGRLGAICHDYHPNLYGAMNDDLNQGMETDRLTASWYIRHSAVADRLAGRRPPADPGALLASGVPLLTVTTPVEPTGGSEPYFRLMRYDTGLDAETMLVEVPVNFQAIKSVDNASAKEWRLGVRSMMTDLFARGYAAIDLLKDESPGQLTRCYYLIGKLEPYLRGAGSIEVRGTI